MKWIFYNTLPIVFLIFAAWLVYLNKDGWGWLVFLAALTGVMPKTNNEDE